jgi:Transposase DDE domain
MSALASKTKARRTQFSKSFPAKPSSQQCPLRVTSVALGERSRRERKRIEMRFAHLKRILRLGRLRLRGPRGAQDEFVLAAIAQNLRRLAKLVTAPTQLAPQPAPA